MFHGQDVVCVLAYSKLYKPESSTRQGMWMLARQDIFDVNIDAALSSRLSDCYTTVLLCSRR